MKAIYPNSLAQEIEILVHVLKPGQLISAFKLAAQNFKREPK